MFIERATVVTTRSKALLVAQMYNLGGRPIEPLGPGSKEKKSALNALGRFVGLDLVEVRRKTECGQRISDVTGSTWDEDCFSTGDTITTVGLQRLVDGAVDWHISQPSPRYRFVKNALETDPAPAARRENDKEKPMLEKSEIEENLSGYLSELSFLEQTPLGVEPSIEKYSKEDLLEDASLWREALSAVQGWLNFNDNILDESIEAFDQSLARELGVAQEYSTPDLFFTALSARLEIAVDYAEKYVEDLEGESEGESTRETASATWVARWEEFNSELEVEVDAEGPIIASARTWPIQQFVQYASDDSLNLSPSYQRADVWPTPDAQTLISSVLRGIPLPSVILLQQPTPDGEVFEVVDGKQRLTSILRFIGRHPSATRTVRELARKWGVADLEDIFRDDYPTFKKLWKKHEIATLSTTKEKELYFPFKLRTGPESGLTGELASLQGKYYSEITEVVIQIVGRRRKLAHIFQSVSDYQIPVIIYEDATSEQVHEVFSLYNKQGKHLNAEEIRNALFHRVSLMRALLLTAGDADSVSEVAPFLEPVWQDLRSTGIALERLGFGKAGYKRTKLLSWVASVLFYEDGRTSAGSRSTALQINAFLKSVKEQGFRSPLNREEVVRDAMLILDHGIDVHGTIGDEIWTPSFRNAQKGSKWQELQLVAVLIALCAASVKLDREQLVELIESNAQQLTELSATWIRPEKTQTKAQWLFISRVVGELLEVLGLSVEELDQQIRTSFGSSGLVSLTSISSSSRVAIG